MAKRVYFGFSYQDVKDFRANVVRNHNFTGGVESAGYYDHSIWEENENTNPLALKRLINAELENTSVTAVLIGSDTWARRWVRYEIMKSIERGNRVIGIHINSITGKDGMTKVLGSNPFDNLGLEISADGTRAKPTEWKNDKWCHYSDLEPFLILQQPQANRGKHLRLSHWLCGGAGAKGGGLHPKSAAGKRGGGMNAKARSLKIEAIGDFAYRKIKPRIRLSGHWLERAGFKPGHRATIHTPKPGELTLQCEEHAQASG